MDSSSSATRACARPEAPRACARPEAQRARARHRRHRRLAARLAAPLLVVVLAVSLLGVGAVTSTPSAEAAGKGRPAAKAIRFALNQLGDPYRYGANGPHRWDCSSLTKAAYRRAGIWLPRVSRHQYRRGARIARGNWRAGDLVAWGKPVYHIGIYMGGGRVLHAPRSGRVVSIDKIWSGVRYYAKRPAGRKARHLLAVKPGMAGAHVAAVQKRLRANGRSLKVTGHYNQVTRRAVKRIQARKGWKTHGTTGKGVWKHLVRNGAKSRRF
jgi:cell wall-associated NlpC family hydrolase